MPMGRRVSASNHILKVCSKMIWWSWMRRRRWLPRRPTNEHTLITAESPPPPHRRVLGGSTSGRRCGGESAARHRTPSPTGRGRHPHRRRLRRSRTRLCTTHLRRISIPADRRRVGSAAPAAPDVGGRPGGAGCRPAYQARRIAAAIRHLTVEQATWVDARAGPVVGAVSWGRLQTLLEAASYQSRPGRYRTPSVSGRTRAVCAARPASEQGLKLIIARATRR
jgi:hypothetical protein